MAPSVFRPNEASSGDQMSHLTLQRQHFLPSLTGGVLTKEDGAPSPIDRPVMSSLTPAPLQPQQQRPSPACSLPPDGASASLLRAAIYMAASPPLSFDLGESLHKSTAEFFMGAPGARRGGCLIVSEG